VAQLTGKYALVNKKDRLSDIILRAGGLTSLADIKGFALKDHSGQTN
jgi:protein involved in polysaccharide export with SLBB domain